MKRTKKGNFDKLEYQALQGSKPHMLRLATLFNKASKLYPEYSKPAEYWHRVRYLPPRDNHNRYLNMLSFEQRVQIRQYFTEQGVKASNPPVTYLESLAKAKAPKAK